MSDKDFLSVEEVAKRLGLKEETIRTYIREGSLNAYRFGNVLRVRVDDFEKFVEVAAAVGNSFRLGRPKPLQCHAQLICVEAVPAVIVLHAHFPEASLLHRLFDLRTMRDGVSRAATQKHGHVEKRIQLRRVRDDEHVAQDGRDDINHALDDPLPVEIEQGFGMTAHARALAAGLNDAGHPSHDVGSDAGAADRP